MAACDFLKFLFGIRFQKCQNIKMKKSFIRNSCISFIPFAIAFIAISIGVSGQQNHYYDGQNARYYSPPATPAYGVPQKQTSGYKPYKAPKSAKAMTLFGIGHKKVWDNRIVPGITFNYRDGYTLTLGPRLTYLKAFSNDKALRTSISYVPLMMSDFKAGYGKIGYTDLKMEFTHHLNRKVFYQFIYDANHFKPNSNLRDYVKSLGAKIDDDLIHTFGVSVGYRLFDLKMSLNGRRFPIPIYLKATYRFGENYKFGTYVADAGNQYDLRNEFRISIWPMLRKF